MASKTIKFSGSQLIIENTEPFTVSDFNLIQDSDTEHFDVKISDTEKETLNIKKIEKIVRDNRFVSLYFNEGNKFPYSEKVTKMDGDDLKELDNPREADMIEMNGQLFLLIDCKTQRMWLSDQRQRTGIVSWLNEKLKKNIYAKSIIAEDEFIEKIKSVSEISFTVFPNLFNSSDQNSISSHLSQDIFGFDAERARVQLYYRNSNLTDRIKKRLQGLIAKKSNFVSVTVIGRSDEGLDTIFNLEEIVSKVSIQVAANETSTLFDANEVFLTLEKEIKSHD